MVFMVFMVSGMWCPYVVSGLRCPYVVIRCLLHLLYTQPCSQLLRKHLLENLGQAFPIEVESYREIRLHLQRFISRRELKIKGRSKVLRLLSDRAIQND